MSSLEEFENALKDVVSSKRVSVSKMNRLSDVAKRCFENDAQMVSTLYRTHKALQPQYKVPSLYAFDALARAARSHATKHGFVGDSQPGSSATFLLKLEAILEGLFRDMMGSGVSEGKEKAKKILDIWTKSATFPPAVLTRLENVLKGDDAPVPAPVLDAVIEPVMHSAPPQTALNPPETPTNPTSQAASVHAALLALLSQARNVPISAQTTTNNTQPTQVQLPQLDANQLKLFQQLTQTVNPPEITTPPIQTSLSPPPAPTLASPDITAGPSNQPTYWNHSQGPQDKSWDVGQVGRNYPISSVEESDYHSPRGRFRGGFRSRGRGRFGDRDREGFRDRLFDRARSPGSAHGRRSRSRSPPRRESVKPYSPPHRPSNTDQTDNHDVQASSSHPGVDEFGREIRPSSDDDRSMTPDDLKQGPPQSPPATSSVGLTSAPTSVPGNRESPVAPPSQAAFATGGRSDEHHAQDANEANLQSFDYSAFDPTSPTSWESLGKAWAATNGRSPTQEELMMFVMEFTIGMASQAPPSVPPVQASPQAGYGWMGESRGGPPRGRGAFRGRGGRGGFAHNAGGGQKRWDNETDAIVLGEHTNNQNGSDWAQGSHEQAQASPDGDDDGDGGQMESGGSTAGGRMQKVGDNWVFVRDDGSS
ncbi:hypothetical protein EDB92DRAFT_1830611 [Lactarius akahatsu]|uniref:CID domain-containing protein n=1 Tax=Lactarius akahatsu TaxID=416441 RepID=A0AAD4LS55_9AGAM|nr:hypothetical protein EDB92DRAFT_1830611 [Lactarius akahatsu]